LALEVEADQQASSQDNLTQAEQVEAVFAEYEPLQMEEENKYSREEEEKKSSRKEEEKKSSKKNYSNSDDVAGSDLTNLRRICTSTIEAYIA
jgi:hypothetical protein